MKSSTILFSAAAIAKASAYFYDGDDSYGADIYARDYDSFDTADSYEMGSLLARSLFEEEDDYSYPVLGARQDPPGGEPAWNANRAAAELRQQQAAVAGLQGQLQNARAHAQVTNQRHATNLGQVPEGLDPQHWRPTRTSGREAAHAQAQLDQLNNQLAAARGGGRGNTQQLHAYNLLHQINRNPTNNNNNNNQAAQPRPELPEEMLQHIASFTGNRPPAGAPPAHAPGGHAPGGH